MVSTSPKPGDEAKRSRRPKARIATAPVPIAPLLPLPPLGSTTGLAGPAVSTQPHAIPLASNGNAAMGPMQVASYANMPVHGAAPQQQHGQPVQPQQQHQQHTMLPYRHPSSNPPLHLQMPMPVQQVQAPTPPSTGAYTSIVSSFPFPMYAPPLPVGMSPFPNYSSPNGGASWATTPGCPQIFTGYKLRSGKWISEEEAYASLLIQLFDKGMISECNNGITLRGFLATKLHCAPMRISKKYAGKGIGKKVFLAKTNGKSQAIAPGEVAEAEKKLRDAEAQFYRAAFSPHAAYSPQQQVLSIAEMTFPGLGQLPPSHNTLPASNFPMMPGASSGRLPITLRHAHQTHALLTGISNGQVQAPGSAPPSKTPVLPLIAPAPALTTIAPMPPESATPKSQGRSNGSLASQLHYSYLGALQHQKTDSVAIPSAGSKMAPAATMPAGYPQSRDSLDVVPQQNQEQYQNVSAATLNNGNAVAINKEASNSGAIKLCKPSLPPIAQQQIVQVRGYGPAAPTNAATISVPVHPSLDPTKALGNVNYKDPLTFQPATPRPAIETVSPVISSSTTEHPPGHAGTGSQHLFHQAPNSPDIPDLLSGFDKVAMWRNAKTLMQCSPPLTSRSFDEFHHLFCQDLALLNSEGEDPPGYAISIARPYKREEQIQQHNRPAKNPTGQRNHVGAQDQNGPTICGNASVGPNALEAQQQQSVDCSTEHSSYLVEGSSAKSGLLLHTTIIGDYSVKSVSDGENNYTSGILAAPGRDDWLANKRKFDSVVTNDNGVASAPISSDNCSSRGSSNGGSDAEAPTGSSSSNEAWSENTSNDSDSNSNRDWVFNKRRKRATVRWESDKEEGS